MASQLGALGVPDERPLRTPTYMAWETHISAWSRHLRAAGRPRSTVRLRIYHVRALARACRGTSPLTITAGDLEGWLGRDGWKPATRRSCRSSLVVFFRWLHGSGRRSDDPALMLPPVSQPRGKPRPAPREVILRALTRADDRTRLILMLAAHEGLRRGEIAAVHTRDLVTDVVGEDCLRVTGKGGHTRLVPLAPGVAAELRRREPGYVFPGRINGHLSAEHVGVLARRVLPQGWTLHTLRHHFASAAYSVERDLRAVQELLGHASVATTQIYTAIPDGAKRRAVLGVVA